MNEYWKERIQFIRDLQFLRTVSEDNLDGDDIIKLTLDVQDIVELQLKEFLQQTLAVNPKKKKAKK